MTELSDREMQVFAKHLDALPLYAAAKEWLLEKFGPLALKVDKTQISFKSKYNFAILWPPVRAQKDWPKPCVGLSFVLDEEIKHPRIAIIAHPTHNRWTHHVLIASPGDLDNELLELLQRAYVFSLR